MPETNQYHIAFVVGMAIGALLGYLALHGTLPFITMGQPTADPYDTEYHVHADFHIVIQDERLDLSDGIYMTTSEQELHEHLHLHDGDGDVQHIHAEDQTFATFIDSLGFTLTDTCFTMETGTEYCSNADEELLLFVNNERYIDPITSYIPADEDRVLLYYGETDNQNLNEYLEAIPDDACYYSGTCPERGIAPPESCGLTCEL